jgi:hypothetical protein
MMWLFAIGGLAGLLLGFWFRAPALIAASGIAAVIGPAAAIRMGLEFLPAVGLTFALLAVLQVGYIAGLMLSCARSRTKFLLAQRDLLSSGRRSDHIRMWRPGSRKI